MNTSTIIILVVVAIVLIVILSLVIWWIGTMNRIRKMQVSIEESRSDIDVALNKRFDLLTKQLAAAKGYMDHEKETLALVTKIRAGAKTGTRDIKEMSEFNSQLNKIARSVDVTFERYPDLKAVESVKYLQASITDVEEHLQAAHRLYNSNVSTYNKAIIVFPNSLVANAIKAQKSDFFVVEESKRQDVEIKF